MLKWRPIAPVGCDLPEPIRTALMRRFHQLADIEYRFITNKDKPFLEGMHAVCEPGHKHFVEQLIKQLDNGMDISLWWESKPGE